MSKTEFFNTILQTTADVCNVKASDIMNGCRREDVCGARSIVVFWCNAAGFTCQSLLTCIGRTGANSIKSIQQNIEDYWKNRFAYHMFVKEVGERLLKVADSIGETFDIEKPMKHISKITNKYYYTYK